ncbi:histidine kinase [Nonomuraea sp. NBC_01738]|uniref:sensor histidine kinase n=1 Tax=Nonomuraea sp. NBC_01738 TaxID=2976003 RepID=UPI002E0D4D75|nr:histidine kinase [Nonomuraea sp. NBC_01738]
MLAIMWLVVVTVSLAAVGVDRATWPRIAGALLLTVGFTWFYARLVEAVLVRRYALREVVVAGVLAFAAAGVGGAEPFGWGFVPLTWLAIAVVGVRRRTMVIQCAVTSAVVIGMSAVWAALGANPVLAGTGSRDIVVDITMMSVVYVLMSASLPAGNRLWVWIWRLAVQAHEGKEAQARLAVAEERLRFARDLHDLVGHQLSALAVKSELAVRLADANIDAAKAEMAEVRDLTRKALRELREAVRGYRELDLPAELRSVKSVLEAAGVRCELHLPYRDVPGDIAPVFAVVVREAVTNVLKHSTATFCDITLRFTGDDCTLEVRNDGVVRRGAADLGSGLTGLGERLAAVRGTLTALPGGDGEFSLKAIVPR